ncbi:MAG TPA: GAF domain-containing protein, partial [Candidatus Baltobacteraceae bacterium]|nr:GAF domain-containing protein [Candidatus Baltobacteraceae bacterium]
MSGVLVMAGVAFVAMVTGGLLVYWVRGNRRGPDWALFEQNPQPVFVWEEGSGRILAANQSACDAYGFSRDEFVSMSAFDLRLEDPDSQRAPLPTAGSVVERAHRRRDGSVREGEVYTSTAHWRGKPAMMALVVDVTERNQSERQARRISRFYATASKINRTIFGLHGQAEMFQAACDIAVEAGEFPLAWIGVPNETTGFLEVAASAGSASAYLANIRVTMRGDVPEGRGPLGTAMRERRIVRENDFLNSWTATPWRSDAARHGLRALLCAPIERDGAVVAGFGLYGSDAGMFGEQETRL